MFEVFLTVLANVHIQQMMMMTDFTDHRDIPDFVLDINNKHVVCELPLAKTAAKHLAKSVRHPLSVCYL